jgi:ubiquinone/menaquinone biosynthesis C-methylase UbiE
MNKSSETVNTYNKSAKALAQKFDDLGARTDDIEEVFNFLKKDNAKVFEIGCGNGRDAKEIIKWTNDYLGMDISVELIKLAQKKVPQAEFLVADVNSFEFPEDVDIVFAFASLIHVDKDDLKIILKKLNEVLNSMGVIRMSMKYSDEYKEITKEDEFGIRTYYLYSRKDIEELAIGFSILKNDIKELRGQKWLEIMLQKKSYEN